jgi:hypothetical protein
MITSRRHRGGEQNNFLLLDGETFNPKGTWTDTDTPGHGCDFGTNLGMFSLSFSLPNYNFWHFCTCVHQSRTDCSVVQQLPSYLCSGHLTFLQARNRQPCNRTTAECFMLVCLQGLTYLLQLAICCPSCRLDVMLSTGLGT